MSGKTDQEDWLDELYRSGRAEEPSADLDAAIRRAAVATPRPERAWYRRPARLAGLAMAATVVLAAGVVLLSRGVVPVQSRDTLEADAQKLEARSAPAPRAPARQVADVAREDVVVGLRLEEGADSPTEKPTASAREQDQTYRLTDADHRASDRQAKLSADAPPPAVAQRSAAERPAVPGRVLAAGQSNSADGVPGAGSRVTAASSALTIEDLTPEPQSPVASLEPGDVDCVRSTFFDVGERDPYLLCTHSDGSRELRHADCEHVHPIATDATIPGADAGGVIVTEAGKLSIVTCHDGGWVVSEDEPDP